MNFDSETTNKIAPEKMNGPNLDMLLHMTRRRPSQTGATITTLIAGVLYVASAIQLALLPLASPYDKAPYLFGIFGLALLILAVQVHRKKLWAVWTTTFLCGALGLATGGWLLLVLNHGLISPLLFLLPIATLVATIFSAVAISGASECQKAYEIAKQKGYELSIL